MTHTVRPASEGTDTGREQEQAIGSGSKSHHENTQRAPTQVRNSQLLKREQFPKLSDEQWHERRVALQRVLLALAEGARPDRPRNPNDLTAVILDYFKTPRHRWRRFR